jgi:hypothetical protein
VSHRDRKNTMDTTLIYILIGSNIALVVTFVAQQMKKPAPRRTKKGTL